MCWMTKCFIFYCIAGRVNMTHHTTAKAHLSRTSRWWLSFQTWRIQWTNTTAACWAPPGTWAMKGRETHWQMCDSTALCPMGDSPVLAAGESMHTARHWAAPTHRHFVTRNKGAVQTSSFVCDWLRGFFCYWARPLQWCLQMQWQCFALAPMSISKRCTYRLFGKGIKCFKSDAVESKKTGLETPHLPED